MCYQMVSKYLYKLVKPCPIFFRQDICRARDKCDTLGKSLCEKSDYDRIKADNEDDVDDGNYRNSYD